MFTLDPYDLIKKLRTSRLCDFPEVSTQTGPQIPGQQHQLPGPLLSSRSHHMWALTMAGLC